ncbi:hypothetical protein BIW11_10894 [Tropilaelaps mercedesae]|uniref:Vezatin n=1 Tax=Tropilaelaps mercedesae TaxID=418985 RepID=A0A1V9XE48_9ACAR|nr:hypothetical protein BIW11_10894 [Tropilaelaps mercedesae]
MAMLESSDDVDPSHPNHRTLIRSLQEPAPPQPLSYWGSLRYTARWYTNRVIQTATNVQKSVIEPYEIYDSIVRQLLTSRLLLAEDRAFVESVLNSETNLALLDERRKWPETYRARCLISTLAVFAALLCLRRHSKLQLVSLVSALGVTASKFLSVSMLKLSVLQLTAVQSMHASLLKWALVQVKDDESFHAQDARAGPSTSRPEPSSAALVSIETMAREDSELFARNVFETLQAECLLWQVVSRDTRSALLDDDVNLIMPTHLDDCQSSCPKLFQSEGLAESTDNFSYGAVQSLKTLNDLYRSECLRNLCLALVQRCHLSLRSVFLCKKALDTVVSLQSEKYDFLCKQHTDLKAKQSSLFTRLNTQYRNGSSGVKSKYADCDVSVRMLCTNLERCLQLATAIHYEIQEGQEPGSVLSLDAVNELIEILNGNLTQSVSFSADLQLRVNNKRQQRSGSQTATRRASVEQAAERGTSDIRQENLSSEPEHDEVYVGRAEKARRADKVDVAGRSRDFGDREPTGASLAPPVLNQLKDVLKAKEAERIERETAAMKRLGLEELPSSDSENDLDDDVDRMGNQSKFRLSTAGTVLANVGHTGFAPPIASQAAAAAGTRRASGGGDDFIYDTESDDSDAGQGAFKETAG